LIVRATFAAPALSVTVVWLKATDWPIQIEARFSLNEPVGLMVSGVDGLPDDGTTDGGATEGGATDGGATDGGATDGGASEGGATDGGATDGGATDGGASDGGTGVSDSVATGAFNGVPAEAGDV
jgi:hypothetical protein